MILFTRQLVLCLIISILLNICFNVIHDLMFTKSHFCLWLYHLAVIFFNQCRLLLYLANEMCRCILASILHTVTWDFQSFEYQLWWWGWKLTGGGEGYDKIIKFPIQELFNVKTLHELQWRNKFTTDWLHYAEFKA